MFRTTALVMAVCLLSSFGFKRKKYENPITKDTVQPDKVLFDKAMVEVEKSRFEVARLLLQNLMNTYDTSEFMAKAKLLYADSYYREGGAHGLAQAEAEYKDFILFYPQMEEAAEAQQKVCMIHVKQMEKPDRDPTHAIRAEDECRQLLVQFPNSKAAKSTEQLLRNIQEVRAESEFRVGTLYHAKQSRAAAAARYQDVTDQYPLYSRSDEALWNLAADYEGMGNRFRKDSVAALQKIVREYPLSGYADDARKELARLEAPIPQADKAAYDRMKYNLEHREKSGKIVSPVMGLVKTGPNTNAAAKMGAPQMNPKQPSIPASVPQVAAATGTNEILVDTNVSEKDLAAKPDARMNQPGTAAAAGSTAGPTPAPTAAADSAPAATAANTKGKKAKKTKKKSPDMNAPAPAAATTAATPAPAATAPPQ